VAVLLDGATASSAEAIAISFRPRPNTRSFGQPTAGYSTANRGARMSDGANLVVTVGVMTDRAGRAYGNPIEPDERVEMPAEWWPSPVDAVARRATTWLAGRLECSAKD
jgi:C-terminal processing protease CtpA/Prc